MECDDGLEGELLDEDNVINRSKSNDSVLYTVHRRACGS